MKKIKLFFVALLGFALLTGGASFLVITLLDQVYEAQSSTSVIDQGKPVWIPPPEPVKQIGLVQLPDPSPAPEIRVKTEVVRKSLPKAPLSKITTQPLTSAPDAPALKSNQAIVERVEDKHGNTTIKILTPVTPVSSNSEKVFDDEEEDEQVEISEDGQPPEEQPVIDLPDLEIGQTDPQPPESDQDYWMVETEIFIPRARSRWKPICFLVWPPEPGLGWELLRLEQKPPAMPQRLFDPLEGSSIDLVASIKRGGLGGALEPGLHLEIGAALTADWSDWVERQPDPQVEWKVTLYAGWQF